MAAKDMVDRVTGWMEDTAEMQTESMLELADAIRDEHGIQQSDAFVQTIKPALEAMYDVMETTRGSLTQGVGLLTGEGEPVDTMGDEVVDAPVEPEAEMEPTVDQEDEFAAAAPAAGGAEEAGRAKKVLEAEPNVGPTKLVQLLRTIISSADSSGTSIFLPFVKPDKIQRDEIAQKHPGAKILDINKLMQNIGGEQFDYGTFKAAYDTDPRVKTMVANFSEKGIEPKTKKPSSDIPQADAAGPDKVGQMAKSATDVGAKL
jgi:hypothetical protein